LAQAILVQEFGSLAVPCYPPTCQCSWRRYSVAVWQMRLPCQLAASVACLCVSSATAVAEGRKDNGDRLRAELAVCERRIVSRCIGGAAGRNGAAAAVDSFREGTGCVWGAEAPPPATTLFPDTEAAEMGLISRSLRFGRVLWCLASLQSMTAVLELFAGTGGGSTMLLAHGLSRHKGSLYSFERETALIVHAEHVLRGWGLAVASMRAVDAPQLRGAAAGTWLLHGGPVEGTKDDGPLATLCAAIGAVDAVVLDPQFTDLAVEWPIIERQCEPRFVAIHNTNLLGHAGWVRERLLAIGATRGAWLELLNGSHPSLWEPGERRSWSVLWRVSPVVHAAGPAERAASFPAQGGGGEGAGGGAVTAEGAALGGVA